jgi:membrane-bound serine protease (ClpP class)
MALVIALLLAIFVLPSPWNLVAVVIGGSWEIATAVGALWWTTRRQAVVGAEALIGAEVEVREPLTPAGRVRVKGELWQARCATDAAAGDHVRVVGIDGLVLLVEPVTPPRAAP